ncbi:MAG: sigma-54 interaction domain-containing protein [Calditrichia bacterium]
MKTKNPFEALVKISEEINLVHSTPELLDRVMDIAVETLSAERGFILLKTDNKEQQFEAVTARNISKSTISGLRKLSSSIVNKALSGGEPILTLDAQTDERFSGAQSIVMQGIRSVICAPLISNGNLIGAIYMDTRTTRGRFDEESLRFLQAFARQAAVAIENARLFETLQSENRQLRRQIQISEQFPEMVGHSTPLVKIFERIRDVADTIASVLIEGESGTGKELVARAIHFHSGRKERSFIPVFCGSLAEQLLESELFGHKKGAFTGAIENKRGLFEEANGGTLFLDEIGDIDKNIQTKLLRVLQEGEIKRVGESQLRKVDVRIIAATNRDLLKEVETGNFREDLYYRLNVINIKLPPLRERRDDIPLLAEHFLKKFAEKNKKNIRGFTREAMDELVANPWKGNIRELENTIERAVVLCKEEQITPDLFHFTRSRESIPLGKTLEEIEKFAVLQTLEMCSQNRTKTAEILGVSRRWLQYRLKEWGIISED